MLDDAAIGLSVEGLKAAATWFAHIAPHEIGRYGIAAGGLALFLVLARRWKPVTDRKIRPTEPPQSQRRREALASLRTCLVFSASGVLSVWGGQAGLLKTYEAADGLGWLWFWLSIVVLIVLHDAWFYWTHRLIHDPRLFRRFHRLHHRSHQPTPFTAYSFDLGEAAINAAFVPLISLILPISHVALFVFLTHMILRNVIGHSGYELFPATRGGRPLFDFMTTVTHHDLHHAQAGWNYGLYFTWWDRVMKTEHPLYLEKFAAAVGRPLDGSAVRAMQPRRLAATVVAASVLAAAAYDIDAQAADAEIAIEQIAGVWVSEGHGAHIALSGCDDDPSKLCGRMVWSFDPAIAAKQGDKLLLGGFKREGTTFVDGWLANPEDGRTYRGEIRVESQGVLRLKGCALVFCRSEVWRRIDDIPGCAASADSIARAGVGKESL